MKLSVVPYAAEHVAAVGEFNARLARGGIAYALSRGPVPEWLPSTPGAAVFQEHYLVLEDERAVRGGFTLKQGDFRVAGEERRVAFLQLPLSEGVVDPRYHALGVFIIKNALKRAPLMYGLGMGGTTLPVARTLAALGFFLELVPFYFRVERPFAFLRNIEHVRSRPGFSLALDALAYSGLGWLAGQALRLARPVGRIGAGLRVETPDGWGDWADETWRDARGGYRFAAVRDRRYLDCFYPASDPKFLRLRLSRGDKPLGWAVLLCAALRDSKYFGAMTVGTLVDCLALPGSETDLVRASAAALRERGADLIVTNQAGPHWCDALERSGFLRQRSNCALALSPALTRDLAASSLRELGGHITRGDGDGPLHLF